MDYIDQYIIETLSKDARTSYRKIAQHLNKSTDTIINRYKRLTKNGEIRGTTIVLDVKKIGYSGMVAFHIDAISSRTINSSTILETLIKMPNIIVATKTVGEHDLLVLAVVRNIEHLMKISKEIMKINGISNIYPSIWPAEEEICPKFFII